MTRVFNILFRMTTLLAALLIAASCSRTANDLEPDLDLNEVIEGELQARFSLTVPGSASAASRAESFLDEGYDAGEGYENYIDIYGGDFAFYFFDLDDKFVTKLDVTSILPDEQYESSKTYQVYGLVDNIVKGRTLKIVALANWGVEKYPDEPASISDLWDITYDFSAASMRLSSDCKIPLYGVTNETQLNFNSITQGDALYADAGMIHMLRAYSKVEVKPYEYNNSVGQLVSDTLEYVTLTRHNTLGFCAPANVSSQDDYVRNNYADDYVSTPHIPQNAETDTPLSFMETGDGRFIAYIPEYQNIGNSNKARIELKFKDSDKICYIDFCDYSSNSREPFNILRNYWYQFSVSLYESGGPTVVLDVTPYTLITLEPDFGLNRDEDGNVIDKNGNLISYDGDGNQIFRDPDGNIFLIRDKDANNIVAKCSDDSGTLAIDRNGSMFYARKGSSYNYLGTYPNGVILIKSEYNTFRIEKDGVTDDTPEDDRYITLLDYLDSMDVLAVIADNSTKTVIYKLDSNGNLMN